VISELKSVPSPLTVRLAEPASMTWRFCLIFGFAKIHVLAHPLCRSGCHAAFMRFGLVHFLRAIWVGTSPWCDLVWYPTLVRFSFIHRLHAIWFGMSPSCDLVWYITFLRSGLVRCLRAIWFGNLCLVIDEPKSVTLTFDHQISKAGFGGLTVLLDF
jgi:hypothetical protein